jgi:hypothetical protein
MSVKINATVIFVRDRVGDGGPIMVRLSDALEIRYHKTGAGPDLILMHTIRT